MQSQHKIHSSPLWQRSLSSAYLLAHGGSCGLQAVFLLVPKRALHCLYVEDESLAQCVALGALCRGLGGQKYAHTRDGHRHNISWERLWIPLAKVSMTHEHNVPTIQLMPVKMLRSGIALPTPWMWTCKALLQALPTPFPLPWFSICAIIALLFVLAAIIFSFGRCTPVPFLPPASTVLSIMLGNI